jgi:hypothetical protein
MIPRIERQATPLKRFALPRRSKAFVPFDEQRNPDLALTYSNGYVTVEISHDALDAYIELTGDVPLPVVHDAETGDRRTYDARNKVRAVYDASAKIREVSTRSRDGLYVRVNFTDDVEPAVRPAGPAT